MMNCILSKVGLGLKKNKDPGKRENVNVILDRGTG